MQVSGARKASCVVVEPPRNMSSLNAARRAVEAEWTHLDPSSGAKTHDTHDSDLGRIRSVPWSAHCRPLPFTSPPVPRPGIRDGVGTSG